MQSSGLGVTKEREEVVVRNPESAKTETVPQKDLPFGYRGDSPVPKCVSSILAWHWGSAVQWEGILGAPSG